MKKFLIILILFFLIPGILLYLFFPTYIEHGVLINVKDDTAEFFIGNKIRKFKTPKISLEKNTVMNFKYNKFIAYDFNKLTSIEDRIMLKTTDYYELEHKGNIKISNTCFYYQLDKDNKLTIVDNQKLIVGKNNIKSFLDSTGKLKTFILSPMDYSNMRVAISTTNFDSLYHDKIIIEALAPMKLYSLTENFQQDTPINSIIEIEKKSNLLQIKTPSIIKEFKNRIYIKCDSMNINSINRGVPTFKPNYNGIFEITPFEKGSLIINEVNIEDYLTKVVPSEMPVVSTSPEALKCQAIAARTYAISDMLGNRFASLGFYVNDSTLSQVFNNVFPHPYSTDAIKSTNGIILTYNDTPIDAKYYSTSAGVGVNYKDIWFRSDGSSEDRPYLTTENYTTDRKSLPSTEEDWLQFYKNKSLIAYDSNSPYFRWEIKFTTSQLTTTLNKSLKAILDKHKDFITINQNSKEIKDLPELKNLQNIKPLKRSSGGNLIQLSFIFENATVFVSGDSNIRSAFKCSKDFNGTQISITLLNNKVLNNAINLPSSFFSIEKNNDNFIIYGGGYGHGVGMSQYGAMELAKEGKDYKTILNIFYKDIKFHNIYKKEVQSLK